MTALLAMGDRSLDHSEDPYPCQPTWARVQVNAHTASLTRRAKSIEPSWSGPRFMPAVSAVDPTRNSVCLFTLHPRPKIRVAVITDATLPAAFAVHVRPKARDRNVRPVVAGVRTAWHGIWDYYVMGDCGSVIHGSLAGDRMGVHFIVQRKPMLTREGWPTTGSRVKDRRPALPCGPSPSPPPNRHRYAELCDSGDNWLNAVVRRAIRIGSAGMRKPKRCA